MLSNIIMNSPYALLSVLGHVALPKEHRDDVSESEGSLRLSQRPFALLRESCMVRKVSYEVIISEEVQSQESLMGICRLLLRNRVHPEPPNLPNYEHLL